MWDTGRTSQSRVEKPEKAPIYQDFLRHVSVMKGAHTMLKMATEGKLNEFSHASDLRSQGHPVYHSKLVDIPGVYSNKGYREARELVKSHANLLRDHRRELTKHIDALANHLNQEGVKFMTEEASEMHKGYKAFEPPHNHHFENKEGHSEIDVLTEMKGKHHPRILVPKDNSDIHKKASQVKAILHSVPDYSKIKL
jgi:hypothetical protein